MKNLKWILNRNQTWHAWPLGGRSTLCGSINAEDLRLRPAAAIADSPTVGEKVCVSCSRKAGYVASAVCADATTGAWIGVINRYLKRSHVRVADDIVAELARRLAELGAPEQPEASNAFSMLQPLLLKPHRERKRYEFSGTERTVSTIPHLREALESLPKEAGSLRTVVEALRAWQNVTRRDPYVEKFRKDRVVSVMTQVPNPELYVKHLLGRGLPTLAAMFHPNTLERAKHDTALRGMFSGSGGYWAQASAQLHIVED